MEVHSGIDRLDILDAGVRAEIDSIVPPHIREDLAKLAEAGFSETDIAEAEGLYVTEIAQADNPAELWKFYITEFLPLPPEYRRNAWKLHVGDHADLSLAQKSDAIDARYEFSKARALANGEEWNEAFAPWPQR